MVPPGDETAWTHPPFAGDVDGRRALRPRRGRHEGRHRLRASPPRSTISRPTAASRKGSISFLITGDEEGIAVNGTSKLLDWAAERGEKFDHCILGEPSNPDELGDTIKIGRRGSLNGHLIVTGKQGHVAYPHRADNPIRGLVTLIDALQGEPLDNGSATFPAVEPRIHHRRCRQQDGQSHSRRSARALQHPLQRLPYAGTR